MSSEVNLEIARLVAARFPVISLVTHEEWRALAELQDVRAKLLELRRSQLETQLAGASDDAEKAQLDAQLKSLSPAHQIVRWTSTDGLMLWTYDEKGEPVPRVLDLAQAFPHLQARDYLNPVELLVNLRFPPEQPVPLRGEPGEVDLNTAIYVFCDLHTWLDREDRAGRFNHVLVRALRDLSYLFKTARQPSALILLSPRSVVPLELEKEIQIVDYPLPSAAEHQQRFEQRVPEFRKRYGPDCIRLDGEQASRLMQALSGLTADEADNVLNKALVNSSSLQASDIEEILEEKRQIIRKDGLLEYFDSDKTRNDVGGLERLLAWLDQRHQGFVNGFLEIEDGDGKVKVPLPVPKGILLIGVPGGGKSLTAKVVAKAWSLPLLRLDIGRIFGGTVGQSEENMRRAIRIAKSVAPAVLWLDEVEKAFPRTSGSSDAGTSLRVMNTFLTWLQEKKESVFVVATGNDIEQLPPELTRKGRFDEIFYVGLPGASARREILKIHTRGLPGLSAADFEWLARESKWFTGAEIEQAIRDAMYRLTTWPDQPAGGHSPVACAIQASMSEVVPLARRREEHGTLLLARTLEKARSLAVPASAEFEELPPDDRSQPGQGAVRQGWRRGRETP